ncbi:peptidoglycan DD-metalloendopeptidase family protein [Jeotgalibacillus marinus]|uniref:M23 family metallopeptidase n=1 Tax=Jeotgalibacillus marinus TaxID=86667 RepID=A0ABV3PZR0_9BACL
MREPSLIQKKAEEIRKGRGSNGSTVSPPTSQSISIVNKLIVKSAVSIVIVAICLWIQNHPDTLPQGIKEPFVKLVNSSFSFASMYEEWGKYVGFGETSTTSTVYTSDVLYASPVLSLGNSTVTNQGDQLLITAAKGELVYSAESGIVLFVGERNDEQVVVIQHSDKRQSIYQNILPGALRSFDRVNRGEAIGQVLNDEGFVFAVRDEQGFLDPSLLISEHEE